MDALIAEFRAGQPDAIRALYRHYAKPIATVARAVAGNDQAAIDDIVQQTFTKAWQAAASFDPQRELAPWLYSIARRTAIDYVRRERRPTRGDHAPEVDVAVPPVSLEQTWEAYELRRAMQALPDEEREVVHLSHLLGLTHPEIADRLNVPVGTVKSRSHRALNRLAGSLAHLDRRQPPQRPGNHRGPPDVFLSREQP